MGDGRRAARAPRWPGPLAWLCLVPVLMALHPYAGLVQDARIYLGRGVADRDPAGVGRDILFAEDGQTRFSVLRIAVDGLLGALTPPAASMLLAGAGSLLWLAGAVALFRRLAAAFPCGARGDRVAWAMAVAALALPGRYGAFGAFSYAETIATPRVFAEAAALGGLAALLGRRRGAGGALLLLALVLHPLMALPGLGLAAVLLAAEDRRWLLAPAAAATGLLAAGALGLPVAERLFSTIDGAWWAVLRQRSADLFPSSWPLDDWARIAPRAAAVLIAGTFAAPRARALLWGAAAVAAAGVALAALLGDAVPDLLATQVQPWRALWLLAVLGNAGFAVAAVVLWRQGPGGRLVLAVLVVAESVESSPSLAPALGAAAVALGAALRFGRLGGVTPRVALAALAAAGIAAAAKVAADAGALRALSAAGSAAGEAVTWADVVEVHLLSLPAALGAVALTLAPRGPRLRPAVAAAGLVAAVAVGAALWDGRDAERRGFEDPAALAALRDAVGPAPGPVLWIDEGAETWFALGRPALFNAMGGAPILFSRAMALDWAARGAALERLGLARPSDLAPWTAPVGPRGDLPLGPGALAGFCADPRRPAALVAPGDQAAAVPPGSAVRLWHPPFPIRRRAVDDDGIRWRRIDAFTVVRCG